MLEEALRRGGKDNVTIIVADYQIPKVQPDGHREAQQHPDDLDSTSDSHLPLNGRRDPMNPDGPITPGAVATAPGVGRIGGVGRSEPAPARHPGR